MNARTTLLLLAALIGCAVVASFVLGPGSADRPRAHALLVPGLKPGDVALISATGGGAELLLTRADGAWKLGAAKEPADGDAAEALLAKLAEVREGAVVSTNTAKQAAYGADAETGIAVRLEDAGGKVLAAFLVGRRGPDFASCYLRRDGASEVMLVTPDLRTDFSRPAESWREPAKETGTATSAPGSTERNQQ